MTDKQKYWLRNPASEAFALADGSEERDRWVPRGFEPAAEPTDDTDFVWMRHDGIEQPARLAYGARENNLVRGWVFSTPPEPIDATRDPRLVDSARAAAAPPADTKSTGKPATGAASVKEQ